MDMTRDERDELLALYKDLRVADVRDGMDTLMLHHVGSMSPDIRPLWRTVAYGIAVTARHLPFDGTIPTMTPDEYWKWSGDYYSKVNPYPWMADIQPGDFCVIDQSGVDAGLMGSNNSLGGVKSGARGYVTSGGVRDTDELILQKVPFWSPFCSQKMVQGRLRFDAKGIPVAVGGVTIYPGDVVVADGDGVIVVPHKQARDVARYSHEEHDRDKAGRRKLYQDLGMKPDGTI
jgi:regulator of RNase E activity RraA